MENKMEYKQKIFTARPGYYEWNIYCNDELLYTIDDGSGQIAENLTDDTTYLDLRELAVEYMSDLEYKEKIKHKDFHSVVDALTEAWAYHFGIDKPENKKLKIKLSDGRELIAEVNELDADNIEMAVYVLDSTDKQNLIYQDICLVREGVKNDVECLVWGNKDEEDYTDFFSIGKYESEE